MFSSTNGANMMDSTLENLLSNAVYLSSPARLFYHAMHQMSFSYYCCYI